MILIKVELIKQGTAKSKIKFYDYRGLEVELIVPNGTLQCKDGEYFVTCSEEPIEGATKITVSLSDTIDEEE